jgi:DNA polymerase-3 subunit epsilon
MPPIHFLDFEGSLRSGIVEYGVATWREGAIESLVQRLCRPRGSVSSRETAVHGLGEAALLNLEPIDADWHLFAAWRASGPLGAHAAATENALLKSVWPFPPASPDWLFPGARVADWAPWIDTERLARLDTANRAQTTQLETQIASRGLSAALGELAARHCPAERCRWHCAGYDALASALLFDSFWRVGPRSLDEWLRLSAPRQGRRDYEQAHLWSARGK